MAIGRQDSVLAFLHCEWCGRHVAEAYVAYERTCFAGTNAMVDDHVFCDEACMMAWVTREVRMQRGLFQQ